VGCLGSVVGNAWMEQQWAGEAVLGTKWGGAGRDQGGVCYTLSPLGADPEGLFPTPAGIVVLNLKQGDRVIPLYTPECRQCSTA